MPLSPALINAMHSQETGEVGIWLITIMDPFGAVYGRVSSDPTVRVSDDPLMYATFSRGQTYLFIPLHITLPESDQATQPTARITLDTVEQELIETMRSISFKPLFTLELVLASSPDYVEMSLSKLRLDHVSYNATQMQFQLGYKGLTDEPFPALSFTPNFFPGLFS